MLQSLVSFVVMPTGGGRTLWVGGHWEGSKCSRSVGEEMSTNFEHTALGFTIQSGIEKYTVR